MNLKTGDRVLHIGRNETGTVTLLDDGVVQVAFDAPTPRGDVSIGKFDAAWFRMHPNWLVPVDL